MLNPRLPVSHASGTKVVHHGHYHLRSEDCYSVLSIGRVCGPNAQALHEAVDRDVFTAEAASRYWPKKSTDPPLNKTMAEDERIDLDVIDLQALLLDPEDLHELQRVAEAVNSAFRRHGFLLLKNHGVATAQILHMRETARRFFLETPAELKRACAFRAPVPRAYSGTAKENFAILACQQRPNDLVEKYRMGPPGHTQLESDAQMLYHANKWPENDVFGLQAAMEQYYSSMESLAMLLLGVFEVCLQLPERFFRAKMDRHCSILSVNHYPPIAKQVQRGQLRLAEHTDVDLFTILCPDWRDAYGCLQVKHEGQWARVPVEPETLVVNIGDGFNYWTNDHWRSTCHRVVVPHDKTARTESRIAIGYFVGANHDAPITRLPSSAGDAGDWHNSHDTTYAGWRKMRVQQAIRSLVKP